MKAAIELVNDTRDTLANPGGLSQKSSLSQETENKEDEEEDDGSDKDYNNDGHSQSDNGRDEYNEWEEIVSKAITHARLKAAGALNNAARKLASTFSTAEVAYVNTDDIVAAITQGLSRPNKQHLHLISQPEQLSPQRRSRPRGTGELVHKRQWRTTLACFSQLPLEQSGGSGATGAKKGQGEGG